MTTFPDTITQASLAARFRKAVIAIALVAALLMILQSDAGVSAVLEVAFSYGLGIASIVVVLLLVQFFWARLKQQTDADPMAWYRAYAAQINWGDIVASLFALTVTVSCFTVYKGTVVGAGGYGFDAMFIAWDRTIFAGNDPWVLTHAMLPSVYATKVIDILYHPTFLPMVVGFIVCIAAKAKTPLRYTYMVAYLASFVIIGMITASALHSAGPIYEGTLFGDGQTFDELAKRLAAQNTEAGPFSAVFAQGYLLQLNEQGTTGIGGGISAMPSMHIVLAFLWVFAAYHLNRVLGIVVTFYAIVIWFGSVHLGWHYFVDGLVGLIMLSVIWYVAGRTFGLYGRR